MNRPVKRPETPGPGARVPRQPRPQPRRGGAARQYALEHGIEPPPVLVSSGIHALRGQILLTAMQAALKRKKRPHLEHRSKPFSLSDANAARLGDHLRTRVHPKRRLPESGPGPAHVHPPRDRQADQQRPMGHRLERVCGPAGCDCTPSGRWSSLETTTPPTRSAAGAGSSRRVLDGLVADVALAAPVLLGPNRLPRSASRRRPTSRSRRWLPCPGPRTTPRRPPRHRPGGSGRGWRTAGAPGSSGSG